MKYQKFVFNPHLLTVKHANILRKQMLLVYNIYHLKYKFVYFYDIKDTMKYYG